MPSDKNIRRSSSWAISLILYIIIALYAIFILNGDNEIRTRDLLLARQALSQLSYIPKILFIMYSGSHLLSHAVSSIVPSAAYGLTIVFEMGTGVTQKRITTGNILFS